jgi:hypothetical protein
VVGGGLKAALVKDGQQRGHVFRVHVSNP